MLTSDHLYYPYDVKQEDDGRFCAKLVDLPDGPFGWGYNEDSAVTQLTQAAIPVLNQLRLSGKPVTPTSVPDKDTIMVGPLVAITASRSAGSNDIQSSRDSLVYGWTEGADSRKK